MEQQSPATLFDDALADESQFELAVSMPLAQQLFNYFKNSPLFRWSDANNDCEDRANAICMLLDSWGIANCKGWVFSSYFLKKGFGNLTNRWNYHVAAALPVQEQNKTVYYVIDPATSADLIPIEQWALQVTESGYSYHFTKHGSYYIFPSGKIKQDNWHKRNKRNYNWTMQGLSGINGASSKGKAQLVFCKKRVKKTEAHFKKLKNQMPGLSNHLSFE